jgi:hypothetical protein
MLSAACHIISYLLFTDLVIVLPRCECSALRVLVIKKIYAAPHQMSTISSSSLNNRIFVDHFVRIPPPPTADITRILQIRH